MKSILVTGASSGIGEELVKAWAKQGYKLIACGRDQQRLAALQQYDANIITRSFDMTDAEACRAALQDCQVDLVVLCAGTCEYIDNGKVDAALVKRVMETNVLGPVNCLDALQEQLQSGSRVAFVSSAAQWLPFPRAEAYGASKAALTYLANSLRLDWEAKGIAISVIFPGFVDTPLTRKNTFPMPGRISVEMAAKAIIKGLDQGHNEIRFPYVFCLVLRLLALLPLSLQNRLLRRMVTR
ncbi:SDR family NAD(P)-dependent oxidoreductase [Serratia sp. DD3]|uniref:SDR family NAD(P)-dependent oxidoreductase n=1 Tax=Serratia sp. DD3 TaxID=1410619 RepID=UPI0003C52325|nr:SDR family NAD(P)-dependent oxidoreductase [Serratia sp. DD3]KEY59742.1 serine 3-dehydrogenase [Serratia sp. DD3]